MTPLELIQWALAAGASVVIVGTALTIALALIASVPARKAAK